MLTQAYKDLGEMLVPVKPRGALPLTSMRPKFHPLILHPCYFGLLFLSEFIRLAGLSLLDRRSPRKTSVLQDIMSVTRSILFQLLLIQCPNSAAGWKIVSCFCENFCKKNYFYRCFPGLGQKIENGSLFSFLTMFH